MRKLAKNSTKPATTSFADVYAQITARILESMETADRWQKPWNPGIGADGAGLSRPISLSSGKAYRGINTVLLWSAGYSSPLWATYAHWASIGAQVRKGEKGTAIILFKPRIITVKDAAGIEEEKSIPLARSFTVFNAAQVDGYVVPTIEPVAEPERIASAERFFSHIGVSIKHGGNRAFYSPSSDFIQMPHLGQFVGTKTSTALESYYSTLAHESTHSTGHKARLDRDFSGRFGDQAYAFEELVAELGASFLCADLDLSSEPRPDHGQYLKAWIKVLHGDKKAIFKAASLAEKACAYLHSTQPDDEAEAVAEPIAEPVTVPAIAEPVTVPAIIEPVAVPTIASKRRVHKWSPARMAQRREINRFPMRTRGDYEITAVKYARWLADRYGIAVASHCSVACHWVGEHIAAVTFERLAGGRIKIKIPNFDWAPTVKEHHLSPNSPWSIAA